MSSTPPTAEEAALAAKRRPLVAGLGATLRHLGRADLAVLSFDATADLPALGPALAGGSGDCVVVPVKGMDDVAMTVMGFPALALGIKAGPGTVDLKEKIRELLPSRLVQEKKEEKSEVRPKEAVSASDEDVKRLHLKRGCDGERAFQPSKLKKRVVEEDGKDFLAF